MAYPLLADDGGSDDGNGGDNGDNCDDGDDDDDRFRFLIKTSPNIGTEVGIAPEAFIAFTVFCYLIRNGPGGHNKRGKL